MVDIHIGHCKQTKPAVEYAEMGYVYNVEYNLCSSPISADYPLCLGRLLVVSSS